MEGCKEDVVALDCSRQEVGLKDKSRTWSTCFPMNGTDVTDASLEAQALLLPEANSNV